MSGNKRALRSNLTVLTSTLGPAPLLQGEDSKAYDDLLMEITSSIKPSDIIEEILVRDLLNLTWESRRYRRGVIGLIEAAIPKALEQVLAPFMDDASRFGALDRYDVDGCRVPTPVVELVNGWIRRDPKAVERVEALLASGNLTMEDVRARAGAIEINKVERFNYLIANIETRRNDVLHQIEYRRAAFTKAQRRVMQDAVNGEFELVNPKVITQKA